MTDSLEAIAARHGFGAEAARALADALRRGGGTQAQFSHPELGGMGQWSQGGTLMISAMNDHPLKARVAALAQDLADRSEPSGARAPATTEPERDGGESSEARWPSELGSPSASGSQNGIRYAVFPNAKRLAIERNGEVAWHDTLDHEIRGASQSQGADKSLRFSSQHGDVDLEDLPPVPAPGR